MKKFGSLLLSVAVVLAMLFALSGCGSEQDKFVGTWQGTLDMSELLNQAITQYDESLETYFSFDDFSLLLIFTFNSDGTCSLAADKDAFGETYDHFIEIFKSGMTQYVNDLIAAEGVDMTVDDFFTMMGSSLDALAEQSLDKDTFVSLADKVESSGQFVVKDGKLYISDSIDTAPSNEGYIAYSFNGSNELTLSEYVGEEYTAGENGVSISIYDIFPLTLTKQ